MGWVESLQSAIDFMEENLMEDISVEEIAKAGNSSVYHFHRIFSILTDTSIAEYLRRRRLTLAAKELISSPNCRVIDVALKYGYDTPEAFSKAFRRQHGVAPSEARKYKGKLKSYNRLSIQVNLKGVEPMQYSIVEKESFPVVGLKREFSMLNDENLNGIPKMWEDANRNGTSEELIKLNNGPLKGLLGVCRPIENNNKMEYWIASASQGIQADGYDKLKIPTSKWAIFEVHGAMPNAMQETWKQIYSEWFPSSGYEPAGTPELEVYFTGDPHSKDYYSEIWIALK
ncbi:AraC family transcriptional regulator [Falsibacillus albus]|uniref:AraC family transcriptional regulator n=1 Tax=Falsibacillus albus TaxID=2478915 RepID=A0A3L7JUA4_9BACI|nr:AraC family transcriptional regulator [Falsibacillus albus]RLQ94363.1 AraC family transcriptional regulator [Falsibacillus albus]